MVVEDCVRLMLILERVLLERAAGTFLKTAFLKTAFESEWAVMGERTQLVLVVVG